MFYIVYTYDYKFLSFKKAQYAIQYNKVIVMPRCDDCLWIVTDGSVKNRGIAATL